MREKTNITTGRVTNNNDNKIHLEHKHNIFQQAIGKDNRIEYRDNEALVVARFLDDIKQKYGFGQQYSLDKGLKKFGDKGVKYTEKEI